MREVLNTLGKIRGRSIGELRTRSAQMLSARAERYGFSPLARVPDDSAFLKLIDAQSIAGPGVSAEALLDNFRARTSPRFFGAFADPAGTVREMRLRFGARAEAEAVARAGRIVAGRFDLLGLRDLDFGSPPDWHLEPVSGIVTPRTHWSRIKFLDATLAGDKKITWELNRHQYSRHARPRLLAHPRRALRAKPSSGTSQAGSTRTRRRKASTGRAASKSPSAPSRGCGRSISSRTRRSLTPQLFLRALKLLYLHGAAPRNVPLDLLQPEHAPDGRGARPLPPRDAAARIAARAAAGAPPARGYCSTELDRQVRPDGVYFEQSSYYHRYTTDFYTHFLILLAEQCAPG